MKTNIQETINHLRKLDRYASPAPWYIEEYEGMIVTGDEETGEEVGAVFYHALKSKKSKANAAILTEVRNSLPDLLAEIDRLTAENKNLEEAWEDGYKTAANLYYDDLSEPDDFAQEARLNSPYKETN